jgi:CheY-like chemotaxis protein
LVVLKGTTAFFLRQIGVKRMQPRARLILVEDDPFVLETLGEGLDELGFDIVAASSGTQAFAELDAGAAQFEEVITDIDLGIGPDGWEVARRARACVPSIPVVYMSSNSAEWPTQGVANSVFIAKPFPLAQMVAAHDDALAGGGTPICVAKADAYKLVTVPAGSGYAWGIVTTPVDGGETLRESLYETEPSADAEAVRSSVKAPKTV